MVPHAIGRLPTGPCAGAQRIYYTSRRSIWPVMRVRAVAPKSRPVTENCSYNLRSHLGFERQLRWIRNIFGRKEPITALSSSVDSLRARGCHNRHPYDVLRACRIGLPSGNDPTRDGFWQALVELEFRDQAVRYR